MEHGSNTDDENLFRRLIRVSSVFHLWLILGSHRRPGSEIDVVFVGKLYSSHSSDSWFPPSLVAAEGRAGSFVVFVVPLWPFDKRGTTKEAKDTKTIKRKGDPQISTDELFESFGSFVVVSVFGANCNSERITQVRFVTEETYERINRRKLR
jgi:hypothetical protein